MASLVFSLWPRAPLLVHFAFWSLGLHPVGFGAEVLGVSQQPGQTSSQPPLQGWGDCCVPQSVTVPVVPCLLQSPLVQYFSPKGTPDTHAAGGGPLHGGGFFTGAVQSEASPRLGCVGEARCSVPGAL